MKVRECMALVIKSLAKERKPRNLLADYAGNHPAKVGQAMNLFSNFALQADALALYMAAQKPDIYHELGETLAEKSLLKLLEKEGTLGTTVDLLYAGDPNAEITGIGCTFMATIPVIEEAKKRGINFIITHEPTYYHGLDDTSWQQTDAVYRYKKQLLEDYGIAVWRLHDMMHLFQPDMIVQGVLEKLGLAAEASYESAFDVLIEKVISKKDFYDLLKEKLGCKVIRMVGDTEGYARKIGFFVGSVGGKPQISLASKYDPEILVCGEINEWETSAYVRDANAMGKPITLFVIGHQESETAGMEYLAQWLQPKVEEIPVTYLECGPMLDPAE